VGHIVNANAFRLGLSKKWVASWINNDAKLYKKYLHEDLIIFRFIKLFFSQYTIPTYSYTVRRNKKVKFTKKTSG